MLSLSPCDWLSSQATLPTLSAWEHTFNPQGSLRGSVLRNILENLPQVFHCYPPRNLDFLKNQAALGPKGIETKVLFNLQKPWRPLI